MGILAHFYWAAHKAAKIYSPLTWIELHPESQGHDLDLGQSWIFSALHLLALFCHLWCQDHCHTSAVCDWKQHFCHHLSSVADPDRIALYQSCLLFELQFEMIWRENIVSIYKFNINFLQYYNAGEKTEYWGLIQVSYLHPLWAFNQKRQPGAVSSLSFDIPLSSSPNACKHVLHRKTLLNLPKKYFSLSFKSCMMKLPCLTILLFI